MTQPRQTPPINHVLKIILAGVMMWAGLNTVSLLPDGPVRFGVAIAIGLAAMLLLMSGLGGLKSMSDSSNGNRDAR
jgi:uncharacterized membrane protein